MSLKVIVSPVFGELYGWLNFVLSSWDDFHSFRVGGTVEIWSKVTQQGWYLT